jgi:uncharacterized protein
MKIIILFFLAYCGMNFYFYSKLIHAFHVSPTLNVVLSLLLIFMVASIFLAQEVFIGNLKLDILFSYIAYFWLAFIFLFFCSALLVDIYHLLFYLLGLIGSFFRACTPSPQVSFLVPAFLAVGICIYGFFEGNNIRVRHFTIQSPKIHQPLTLVQISDLHLSPVVRPQHLEKILTLVKQVNPDVVISTGDLLDSGVENFHELIEALDELKPPLGKFAITGNHEFYYGLTHALKFTEEAGFTVLRERSVTLANEITLVGIDDYAAIQTGYMDKIPEIETLQQANQDKYIILLKHTPIVNPAALPLFDLQLSGHTHGGQIFPFSYFVRLFFPYNCSELYNIHGHQLYLNRGAGMWGPPIRFLEPPEIAVFHFVESK